MEQKERGRLRAKTHLTDGEDQQVSRTGPDIITGPKLRVELLQLLQAAGYVIEIRKSFTKQRASADDRRLAPIQVGNSPCSHPVSSAR
jgi:hypothetical protein